ncbi:MAG: alpha-amylase family glycosyl hydrolase, partial [Anaerolineales bacterium]
MTDPYLWWRDGVIYQIYPRSFADTDEDGLGDLPGITARLDYLAHLGVDAIWLSPFYPTPDLDFGYDISDHCDVDPRFGTLADFDDLVREAHQRDIRVVLDLVLNHTSDQHPWFLESRASRDNPKRGWYMWQPPAPKGGPPNNWQSAFGGKGWEYDEQAGEYFFHMFVREQPDVNWRNRQVRQAQLDVVRFWLARGADGFRLDVFNAYFKDEQLPNNPPKLGLRAFDRQK